MVIKKPDNKKNLSYVDTIQWPELTPLNKALLPVKRFQPDTMLPESIRGYVVDCAERIDNAPVDFAGVGMVIAAATIIGTRVTVKPKEHDDWTEVPNLWGGIVGRPSLKKTPILKAMMKFLHELEKASRDQYLQDMRAYEKAAIISETRISSLKGHLKKGSDPQLEQELHDALDNAPIKPIEPRLVVNDTTIEALAMMLQNNPNGLLQFRDELTGLLAILSKPDKGEYRPIYLEGWPGDQEIKMDRKTAPSIAVESLTLSLFGGIQPGKLVPLLQTRIKGNGDDGFMERMQLLVYPDPNPYRVDRKPDLKAEERARAVFQKLNKIPLSKKGARPSLPFNNEAQQAFNEWYDDLNDRVNTMGSGDPMGAHLTKYHSLVPTLALIFHLIEHGATGEIEFESLRMALYWVDYLESHARRIYALTGEGLEGAESLKRRLPDLPNPFQTADFSNKGWSGLNTADERNTALDVLCECGYLHKEVQKTASKPKTLYHISPFAF